MIAVDEVTPACRAGRRRAADRDGPGPMPTLIDRIAGALTAVATFASRRPGADPLAPVWDALWWTGQDYAVGEARGRPRTATPPAWVLPAVVVHPDPTDRAAEVQALALCSGWPLRIARLCVRYGELLAAVLAEGCPPCSDLPAAPSLVDLDEVEAAVVATEWALGHPGVPLLVLLGAIDVEPAQQEAVGAAVAAAVGLRDGLVELPPSFHQDHQLVARSVELARDLVRARRANEVQP